MRAHEERTGAHDRERREDRSTDDADLHAIVADAREPAVMGSVPPSCLCCAAHMPCASHGEPLPPATARPFEKSFGADLTDVRVHTDAAADGAAREKEALAFTVGRDIFFRGGSYRPDVLAHELAHTVQQRPTSAPDDASGSQRVRAEREAQSAAAAHFAGGVAPSLSTMPVAPALIGKDPEVASEDKPQFHWLDLDADEYVDKHAPIIMAQMMLDLEKMGITSPIPAVSFDDKLPAAAFDPDGQIPNDLSKLWPTLERKLVPDSVPAIVDAARDPYDDKRDLFSRGVANELSRFYARRLIESLKRIVPRWARVANHLALRSRFDLFSLRSPMQTEIQTSHPVDADVVKALGMKATLDVERYRTDHPDEVFPWVAPVAVVLAMADVDFVDMAGDHGEQGFVRLVRNRTATREDVSLLLTGTTENAWRIDAMAPYFRVPPELFSPEVKDAWQIARGPAPGFGTLAPASQDDLALAAAHDVVPTELSSTDAENTRLKIVDRMAQAVRHLQALGALATPGSDDAQRVTELTTRLTERATAVRDGMLDDALIWDLQSQGLADIVMQALEGAVSAQFSGKSLAQYPRAAPLIARLTHNYILAALAADTASVGYETLAFAKQQSDALEIDLMELTLADMRTMLRDSATAHGSDVDPLMDWWHDDAYWGPFLPKKWNTALTSEEPIVRAEISRLRAQVLQDPKGAKDAIAKAQARVGQFGAGVEMVYDFDLMDQAWDALYQTTKFQLGVYNGVTWDAVHELNLLTEFATSWDSIYAVWTKDRAAGEALLAQHRASFKAKIDHLVTFLDDAATINKWTGFAFMIGVMLVSGGIGGFVEAGVGGGTLGGFAAGSLAEFATFTLLSNALFSTDHSLQQLAKEFGDNTVLFSALKTISMIYVGLATRIGGANVMQTSTVAKAGQFVTNFVAFNTHALVAANNAQKAAKGEGLSFWQMAQLTLENLAFMIAAETTTKFIAAPWLNALKAGGEKLKEVRDLRKMRLALEERAKALQSRNVTVELVRQMLEEQRAYLDLRDQAFERFEKMTDAEAKEAGVDKSKLPDLRIEQAQYRKTLAENEMIASLEAGGPNELYVPTGHVQTALDFYNNQDGTTAAIVGTDPISGGSIIEVRPPDVVDPKTGLTEKATPFKVIEKLSTGTEVARPPELSPTTPADLALRSDTITTLPDSRPPPTTEEAQQFNDWLPSAQLHPDPLVNGLYRARLRDYYLSDPNGAIELAQERYQYPAVSIGNKPLPPADAMPISDATRAYTHYLTERARGKTSTAEKEMTKDDFERMYAEGFAYDPIMERWFLRATTTTASGTLTTGRAITHVVGEVYSEAVGLQAMRMLAAGEANALRIAGVEPPIGLDPRANEWGLGLRVEDGKYVLVRGDKGEVRWEELPGIEPVSHSHPFFDPRTGEERRLVGFDGSGTVDLKDLKGTANQDDLIRLLPSTSDLRVVALLGKARHIQTPYFYLGDGMIGNPELGVVRDSVDIHIDVSTVAGTFSARSPYITYEATITFTAGGVEVAPPVKIHQTFHPGIGDLIGIGDAHASPLPPGHPLATLDTLPPGFTGMGIQISYNHVQADIVRQLGRLQIDPVAQLEFINEKSAGALGLLTVLALEGRVVGLEGWMKRLGADGDTRFLGEELQRAQWLLDEAQLDLVTFENGYLSAADRARFDSLATAGTAPVPSAQPRQVQRVGGVAGQGAVDLAQYVPAEYRTNSDGTLRVQRTILIEGNWLDQLGPITQGGFDIVYALRDANTGEVLKIGKTEARTIRVRISKYQTAGSEAYSARSLALDVLEVKPPAGQTTETGIEKPLRDAVQEGAHAEAQAGTAVSSVLRWDNTNQRLGREGTGTPGARNKKMRKAGIWWQGETLVDPTQGGATKSEVAPVRPTKQRLEILLEVHNGDVPAIATELDVHKSTVYAWLASEGLKAADYRTKQ